MKVRIGKHPKHRFYHNWLYEKFGWSPKQSIHIKIDKWDTWSMDHTLAYIILPMLKQLKATKQGAPTVELADVPKELHGKKLTRKQKLNGETDEKHFDRWDWVLDEMIFAFESKNNDWEKQFYSGEVDRVFIAREDGMYEWAEGPNHTFEVDMVKLKVYEARVANGFRLFGTYFESLWD